MSTPGGVRRLLLDEAPGERRGVVLLDGRPERLLIERDGEGPDAPLGSRWSGRVSALAGDRVFVELPHGPAGVMRTPPVPVTLGAPVQVEVVSEAFGAKGPRLAWCAIGEGARRRLAAAPALVERLRACEPGTEVERGLLAREAADLAQEAALAVEHRFRGGLTLAVEPTRALTAVDVDLAAGEGAGAKRVTEANLSAIRHAVRLLRLKGLGGVTVIDLVGFPEPDTRGLLRAEAGRALAVDGPDAQATAPDRFGLLHLSRPRRERPLAAVLLAADGRPSARTLAQSLVRDLQREGRAEPGGEWVVEAAPEVACEIAPLLAAAGVRAGLQEVADDRGRSHIRRA